MNSFVNRPQATAHNNDGHRLAYLLSSFPAISHTFFLNEIEELRKLGFSIDVASINRPTWAPETLSDPVAKAMQSTFYIKGGHPVRIALVLLTVLLTRPLVVSRGLLAALKLDAWSPRALLYAFFYLAEALLLGDWLRIYGHTHLHVHFGGPVATVGMLTSVAWGIPYSLTIHGPEEFYRVDKSCLRQKVEKASLVLCISDHCRSQLMRISEPAQWNKFHVVRLGVDPQLFAPDLNPRNDDVFQIICVGRLVPDKGQLVLLRAFLLLLSRGHKLQLRLVGEGADRDRLESFISENNLGGSVILEGALNHEATRRLLAKSDVFVLASFAEGLPIALMEAMAMELPCVSTFIAGIPELIRHHVDGLLVPASSEEALVEALAQLIGDPGLRRALACSARQRVVSLYNLQKNVSSLADRLRDLLNQSLGVQATGSVAVQHRHQQEYSLATVVKRAP
jgi:colanic acid/amylovoran biosynthesis glycosyltransferase